MEQNLFQFGTEELTLTNSLKSKIINTINKNGGQIPFSKYMNFALYDVEYGYYTNLLHKFGRGGDFITAPLVSNLFAKCLVKQVHELLNELPMEASILEIGAGNGQLMLDMLPELGDRLEYYYILELSPNLVQLQKQKLYEQLPSFVSKVIWLNSFPDKFNGLILANEVLDSQPCEVIMWDSNQIKQHMVSIDSTENLVYIKGDITSLELLNIAKSIPIQRDTYTSEISLNNRGFIKSLAKVLDTGYIILIDYGSGQDEYYASEKKNGTLRGFFRQHQLDDVLFMPGLVDITANVDFTAIATTAIDSGLDFIGYTTQANFLINCQALDIIQKISVGKTVSELQKLNSQLNYLTSPNEMGNIFKVIGFSKNVNFANWSGFEHNDRSYTL